MLWCAVGEYNGPRITDAFMRYVAAKLRQRQEEAAYRIYITDCVRNISENAAAVSKISGGEGRYVQTRYKDMIQPKPVETRTGEEIIAHIRKKLG